jgi:hypothetical protein
VPRPDDPEPVEVDVEDLAHDEVEPDPDELTDPVPDAERELPLDDVDEQPIDGGPDPRGDYADEE